ncbi:MAG: SIMPL domain-containing protein, partial [Chloroflexota bacterium]
KLSVAPDIAELNLGIEAQALTVAEAQEQASGAMSQVLDALKAAGVKEKDIQTRRFSISPVTRWLPDRQEETLLGYRVSNMVQAKIRELNKAGRIIDNVAAAGGNLTRVQGISFSIDNPDPYYEEARIKAVKDAAAKARKIADTAGVKLGKPFYISEDSGSMPPPMLYKSMAEAASAPISTSISPGELELRLTIQIAYDIG